MKASIVVLSFNQVEKTTRPCLDSILKHTDINKHELIIVDNASSDSTPSYLKDFQSKNPAAKIILNTENYGYAKGNNVGIEIATGDFIILLNNDTMATENWIDNLLVHYKDEKSNWGLISPISNSVGNEQKINIPGLTQDNYEILSNEYTKENKDVIFETDMVGFFCVVIPKKIINEIGVLDEKFGIGMFEDNDYCQRVYKAGYKLGVAENCFVYHMGSFSFKKFDEEKYQQIFKKNRAYFNQKHGVTWTYSTITKSYVNRFKAELSSSDAPEKIIGRLKVRIDDYNNLAYMAEENEKLKYQLLDQIEQSKNIKNIAKSILPSYVITTLRRILK